MESLSFKDEWESRCRTPPLRPLSPDLRLLQVSGTSDQPGYPTRIEFTGIVDEYLSNLHHRKVRKALIDRKTYGTIHYTLRYPRDVSVEDAQFRHWARKKFSLERIPGSTGEQGPLMLMHQSRPVAIREDLYDILCYCHSLCQHGGRDRTSSVVKDMYSYVPRQIVAAFVRKCPTCAEKRSRQATSSADTGAEKEGSGVKYEAHLRRHAGGRSDEQTSSLKPPPAGYGVALAAVSQGSRHGEGRAGSGGTGGSVVAGRQPVRASVPRGKDATHRRSQTSQTGHDVDVGRAGLPCRQRDTSSTIDQLEAIASITSGSGRPAPRLPSFAEFSAGIPISPPANGLRTPWEPFHSDRHLVSVSSGHSAAGSAHLHLRSIIRYRSTDSEGWRRD